MIFAPVGAAAYDWSGCYIHPIANYTDGNIEISFDSAIIEEQEIDLSLLSGFVGDIFPESITIPEIDSRSLTAFSFSYSGSMIGFRTGCGIEYRRTVWSVYGEALWGEISGKQAHSALGYGVSAELSFDYEVALGLEAGWILDRRERNWLAFGRIGASVRHGELTGCAWRPGKKWCERMEGYAVSLGDWSLGLRGHFELLEPLNGFVEISYQEHGYQVGDDWGWVSGKLDAKDQTIVAGLFFNF